MRRTEARFGTVAYQDEKLGMRGIHGLVWESQDPPATEEATGGRGVTVA